MDLKPHIDELESHSRLHSELIDMMRIFKTMDAKGFYHY